MTRPATDPPPPPDGPDAALRRIRDRGGRVTEARRELVRVLYDGPPMTVEGLADRLGRDDRSVLYRNLTQLEELGIAEHVHPGHGQAVYRPAGLPTVLVACNGCGAIREVERDHLAPLTDRVATLTGIDVDLTHLPLTGICRDCSTTTADG